jgi:FKBP-type peptidyl-prolyl cis-trans isomerase
VTLYIENADKSLTPAGWSTKDTGAFKFSPGVNLIPGWTIGALSMKVGERAFIHVPAHLGYGAQPQGQQGRGWYIPGNSNLCFDLEITK